MENFVSLHCQKIIKFILKINLQDQGDLSFPRHSLKAWLLAGCSQNIKTTIRRLLVFIFSITKLYFY